MLQRHAALLSSIEPRFGVPRQIVVAIWGLELDFGKGDIGKMPVIRTLATMAHDCRRTELFQGELLAALKILQRGDLPLRDLIGAFAGEIGQTQFLPSSYIKYGVDFDDNGHVDLRHSVPDVLASTANLLNTAVWKCRRALWRRHREFRGDARMEQGDDLPQDHRVFCGPVGGEVEAVSGRGSPLEPGIHTSDVASRPEPGPCAVSPCFAVRAFAQGAHPGKAGVTWSSSPRRAIGARRCHGAAAAAVHRRGPRCRSGCAAALFDAGRCAARRRAASSSPACQSMDCTRRALLVSPAPERELRTMLAAMPPRSAPASAGFPA